MDVVEPVGIDKESIAQTLQEFVDSPDVRVKFAWGRKLANEEFLESMIVEGIGEIKIPISKENIVRLKEASIQSSGLSCYSVLNNSVRDGWQVDKKKIKAQSPSTFFETIFQNFVTRSLVFMGLDAEALGMDIHFQNLLIYEPGSPFHRKSELKKEPGTFAKLILHVPVEGTSEGGQLRVNYNGDEKHFYYNADSDKQFYSTIFLTDCQHELEEVSSGTKVLMVFNLAWKKPLSKLPPLNQLPAFLKALSELKEMSSKWECKDLVYFPRLLAIPLVHCYDQPISFSGLKDKDRWIANLFKCIDFLDVFLVLPSTMTPSRQTVPDTLDFEDLPNNLRLEDPDDEDENYIPLSCSEVEPSRWIDSSNRPVCFGEVDIHSTELVGNFQVSLPPVVDDDEESLLTDPMIGQMWDQPVLVIWPKKQSVVIACQKQFDAFLDLLERQVGAASSDRPTLILTFNHVLDFCLKRPISVWYRQDDVIHRPRTRRLFELCVALEGVQEGLQLMKILGSEFRAEIATENGGVQAVWFYEGIRNEHVAFAAAAFIEFAGWDKCKDLVNRLIESRVNQVHSFCCLAKCLLERKCMEAAISVAQETLKLLTADADLKAEWGRTALGSCVDLVFRLDGFPETGENTRISEFCSRVTDLDAHLIAYVIIHIGRNQSANLRSATTCQQLYLDLCRAFLKKQIDTSSVPLSRVVADLTPCFLWLEDDKMIQEYIYKMATSTNSNSHNLQLQKMLLSTDVTNQLLSSEPGEKAFRFLIDARIDDIDRFQKPHFTWCQSNASLPPEYSDVEEFLHSPMHSAIFDNFDDTDQITQMVMNYFTPGVPQSGYSAEATIGYGDSGPYCNISKTTSLYESEIAQYQALRKELQHWKTLRWSKWGRNFQDEVVAEPQPEEDDGRTSQSEHFDMNVDSPSKRRVRVVRRFQANPSVANVRSVYRHLV